MNLRNYGYAEGRVSQTPVVFDNKDGSKKLKVKLAVRNNYRSADGQYGTQFLDFDAFISADRVKTGGLGVWNSVHVGDTIGLSYEVQSNQYEKDGQTVYGPMVLAIQQVDLKESKSVTEKRAADRAAKEAAGVPVEGADAQTQKKDPAPEDGEEKPFAEPAATGRKRKK